MQLTRRLPLAARKQHSSTIGGKQGKQAHAPTAQAEQSSNTMSSSSAPPALKLGDEFPNFQVDSTAGSANLHDLLGSNWGILMSHPDDFTPVCTTELGRAADLQPEFEKRNTKLIGLSCNSVESHKSWTPDIEGSKYCSSKVQYPIIADTDRSIATRLGMLDPEEKDKQGLPLTCRALFFISPEKKLKAQILLPATSGRNFDEVLRILDSLQLTSSGEVATPVDWKPGQETMLQPSLTNEEAQKRGITFETDDVPSGKGYLRHTKDRTGA